MLTFSKITFVTLGLLMLADANVANANPQAANSYECMTDDGNGRTRPCSYGYQGRAEDQQECFTDDGNGRRRPCSFNNRSAESPFECVTDDGNGRTRPCSTGVKP